MATKSTKPGRKIDITLVIVGVVLGVALAAGYGAWSAVSAEASDRWSSFAEAMLFPGLLIIPVVAVIVWLGWKANIDG
jgi:hypothetical protein